MNKFMLLVDELSIAEQIANLLNKYNRLQNVLTGSSIITSTTNYLVEFVYVGNTLVVTGCVGIQEDTEGVLIKHLCVDPSYRNQGIATKLLETSLELLKGKVVRMTIRHDNMSSLSVASKLGFKSKSFLNKGTHFVLTVIKDLT